MTTKKPKKMEQPYVYWAVKPVWILRPKFNTTQRNFEISIDVIGTAFWLKTEKCLVTCAHVIDNLLWNPIEQTGVLYVWITWWQFLQASIGSIDFIHDLAVLQLHASIEVINQEALQWLEISSEYVSVWSKIWYAGYPGWNILFSWWMTTPTYAEWVIGNQIRDKGNRKDIQITWTVFGWFSWWPIVSLDNHKLVWVVSNSPRQDMWQAGIFMWISFEHVEAIANLNNS